MSKVTGFISKTVKTFGEALEKAAEREREFVAQDQFHAVNYGEANALLHLRGFYHNKYHCPLCNLSVK